MPSDDCQPSEKKLEKSVDSLRSENLTVEFFNSKFINQTTLCTIKYRMKVRIQAEADRQAQRNTLNYVEVGSFSTA